MPRTGLFGTNTPRFKAMKKLHLARQRRWLCRKGRETFPDFIQRTRHIFCWKAKHIGILDENPAKHQEERLKPKVEEKGSSQEAAAAVGNSESEKGRPVTGLRPETASGCPYRNCIGKSVKPELGGEDLYKSKKEPTPHFNWSESVLPIEWRQRKLSELEVNEAADRFSVKSASFKVRRQEVLSKLHTARKW